MRAKAKPKRALLEERTAQRSCFALGHSEDPGERPKGASKKSQKPRLTARVEADQSLCASREAKCREKELKPAKADAMLEAKIRAKGAADQLSPKFNDENDPSSQKWSE